MTNIDVLQRLQKERELLLTIKTRKIAYLGHILRNEKYELPQLIMNGQEEEQREPGKRQISWMRSNRGWIGLNVEDLVRAVENREKFTIEQGTTRRKNPLYEMFCVINAPGASEDQPYNIIPNIKRDSI